MSFGAFAEPVSNADIAHPDFTRKPSAAGIGLVVRFNAFTLYGITVRKEK
jgi:hypothetical protein